MSQRCIRFERLIATLFAALLLQGESLAADQSVNRACIKNHKCVPLDQFTCARFESDVRRVCYAKDARYMIIWFAKHKPYHICDIEPELVGRLLKARSKGRFFDADIRSSSTKGKYDCRKHPIPKF